jgi:creatinine amidohydrolase/Fe(II)-dependent formamide hydrolase-like protein
MWWGANGGHGGFRWTHYQSPDAAGEIVATTTQQLLGFGFRVVVLLAGHYPWQQILDARLPPIQQAHPDALLIWGSEMSICGWEFGIRGDHAAREETSFGLSLLPEHIDMTALTPGRTVRDAWPGGVAPADVPDVVKQDPSDPLFAQAGEDARLATADRGEESIARVVSSLTERISRFLTSRR